MLCVLRAILIYVAYCLVKNLPSTLREPLHSPRELIGNSNLPARKLSAQSQYFNLGINQAEKRYMHKKTAFRMGNLHMTVALAPGNWLAESRPTHRQKVANADANSTAAAS